MRSHTFLLTQPMVLSAISGSSPPLFFSLFSLGFVMVRVKDYLSWGNVLWPVLATGNKGGKLQLLRNPMRGGNQP